MRGADEKRRVLAAKCRMLVRDYWDVFSAIAEELDAEVARERVEGDTAFAVAKRVIRSQGVREGIRLVQQRITKYADDESR